MLKDFHAFKKLNSLKVLDQIKESALNQKNIFEVLMEATKHCSLGQITQSLFEVGGQVQKKYVIIDIRNNQDHFNNFG